MTDYRLKQNRRAYFDSLYVMNLQHRVMPGLVYLYLPELAHRLAWTQEQKLWFAFLNGLTQNPITSLVMFKRMPEVPRPGSVTLETFSSWFDTSWSILQFDTDRRYQKKDTVAAIEGYTQALMAAGQTQKEFLTGTYRELWKRVSAVPSFGRLSTFSYLEYVTIMGAGADCDDLMFGDLAGSRSHRNGMLLLMGHDELVMDKRAATGVKGYRDLPKLAAGLAQEALALLNRFSEDHQHDPGICCDISNFTLESNLCTFKNHFYGRRYPGVYADMAWERIEWAEAAGWAEVVDVFKDIRSDGLPEWLRIETGGKPLTKKEKGAIFPATGVPYRGEWFL